MALVREHDSPPFHEGVRVVVTGCYTGGEPKVPANPWSAWQAEKKCVRVLL